MTDHSRLAQFEQGMYMLSYLERIAEALEQIAKNTEPQQHVMVFNQSNMDQSKCGHISGSPNQGTEPCIRQPGHRDKHKNKNGNTWYL